MLFETLLGFAKIGAGLIGRRLSNFAQAGETQFQGVVINPESSSHVKHLMDVWNVTGLSLAVIRPDGETEFGAWGNMTEDGEHVTPDTLFNIGSCSKAFLSASFGILIDDFANGRNTTALPTGISELNWETKVKDILPGEWQLQDQWATENTNILDILSHVSGLPRHDGSYDPHDSPKDLLPKLKYLRPAFELRQRWSYNNLMYMIGAHIISTYTGSYTQFVQERIFVPLGMHSSTFSSAEAAKSGKLSQCWAGRQRIPYAIPEGSVDLAAGAGGIIASAVDLSKWLKMLLNAGVDAVTNTTVVSHSAFNAVTTARAIVIGQGSPDVSIVGYGMGWIRNSYRGHDMVWHNGAIPGFSSAIAFLPNDGLGIAVVLNTADRDVVTEAVMFGIIENMLNLPKSPRKEPPANQPEKPRPENTTTPVPLTAYAGTYADPGYGSATLCAPTGDSHYCREVLSAFSAVDAARPAPRPPVPELYAAWPRMWSSHVRAVYLDGNTFGLSITALFPHGYGASDTPFETGEEPVAKIEFVVEDGAVVGFGLFGTFPPGSMREKNGTSVEERADVWFRKV